MSENYKNQGLSELIKWSDNLIRRNTPEETIECFSDRPRISGEMGDEVYEKGHLSIYEKGNLLSMENSNGYFW